MLISIFFVLHLRETKSMEHACNSALVAIYNCSQGLRSFDVLSYDVHI